MSHPWHPARFVSRDEILDLSNTILSSPDIPITEREDVFRIDSVGLAWDIGVMIYEPADLSLIPQTDGERIGLFLLHGGSNDFRDMEVFARLVATKLGYRVVSMTYPGRLYLDHPDRKWPGETIRDDGSVRTPIWLEGETIDREQYQVYEDTSSRSRYGIRTMALARPDTIFHQRMAGWPAAFEDGMKEACLRHLGEGYSVFVHGHSTGGPFVSMLSQRVSNISGVLAIENSPFGYIQEKARLYTGNIERRASGLPEKTLEESKRADRFDELSVRTWREEARYLGPEVATTEGAQGLMRLPQIIEEVFEAWRNVKVQANFKCEYPITRNVTSSLEAAARTTAERMRLSDTETAALVDRYLSMTRELEGPDVKPVPPTLFGITEVSRDHPEEVYRDVILPMYKAMDPAPLTALTKFGAGVHDYAKPEPGLPLGVAPAVISQWNTAIENGFFEV
jgi:hypothetical protein